MARVSLEDVRAIPDPVQQQNFSLIIPDLGRGIDVRCQTTALPGVNTDSVTVALHGMETKYMGRETFSHTLTCTFVETRDMFVRNSMMAWYKLGRDTPANFQTNKETYEKTAYVVVYDDTGATIKEITLVGCFVEDINETPVDGSAAAAMSVTVVLSFDYFVEANTALA